MVLGVLMGNWGVASAFSEPFQPPDPWAQRELRAEMSIVCALGARQTSEFRERVFGGSIRSASLALHSERVLAIHWLPAPLFSGLLCASLLV